MWEKINYHKNKIFAIILITIFFYGMYVPEEDFEDPYIITIDYDCREIVRDPSDISKEIVQQCNILLNELEEKNASKQSKRSTTT